MPKIKITQIRSTINRIEAHKRTMKALGLKKMHQSKVHEATPQVMGMVNQIRYLLKVEELSE